MADEEGDLFGGLPVYVEEEEPESLATKAEREKRKAEGQWGPDKIWERELEKIKERQAKGPIITYRHLDPQEESSFGPMRHLAVTLKGPQLVLSANILSVKLIESAIGFPLDVYGTIVVRDELDCKRIYLFRRDRDNCQRIRSTDESLSLMGPYRGLVAFKNLYFEIDLKCKNHQAVKDTELGNWFVKDSALTNTSKVVTNRFVGKVCTIHLTYAPAHRAVEVTVEVKIFEILRIKERPNGDTDEEWVLFNKKMKDFSEFHGKITACISGIPEEVVLYDSKADGCVIRVSDEGLLELSRRVVAVPINRKVSFNLVSHDGSCVVTSYPRTCGRSSPVRRVGSWRLQLNLVWSALYWRNMDGLPRCMDLKYL